MHLTTLALLLAAVAPSLAAAPTEDKGRKIRPFCDMIMVPSPPPAYCRKFCTLCGPRIYSDYGKMEPPGKESWLNCMKECANGREWIPRLGIIRNGPEWRPDWIEFKEKMAAKWEETHPHEDLGWVTASYSALATTGSRAVVRPTYTKVPSTKI